MYRLALFCTLVVAPLVVAEDRDKEPPHGDHLDRMARRLERESRELREEVLVHFKGKVGFRDMEGHTREIERQAGRVAKLTDRDARPRMVREALDKIDEEVRDLTRHTLALGRVGGIDRKAYDHLRDELNDITRVLYWMRRELEPLPPLRP